MILKGKKVVIMGVRNKWSIAWGAAQSAYEQGAEVICTCSEDSLEKVKDLVKELPGTSVYVMNDVSVDKDISDCLDEIKKDHGKIDGFLTDEPLAKEIIKENSNLKILDEKLTEDSYAFAINPSKQDLQNEINRVLNKMKQNGKLQELEEKWMGNDESKKELDNYNYDDSKGTIKFATVSGSAPFAYMKNNKIVGYDIDVINYICKELGYKLEVIEMSFDGIIPALKSGKVDVSGCSIIVTEERKKSVLFSEPDYTGGIVVITRR